MDFNCQSCSFSKNIDQKHYAEFAKKYVMDGKVMCPKCDSTTNLTASESSLLGVPAPYVPPKTTRAPKVKAAKTAQKNRPSYEKEISFSGQLVWVSSLVFVLMISGGAIVGALSGLNQGAGITMILGAIFGALASLLPAYLVASAMRFCGYVIKILVDISRK